MTRRSLISCFIALSLLILAAPPTRIVSVFASPQPRQLVGTVPAVVSGGQAQLLGHEPSMNTVHFSLSLSLRNMDALLAFIRDLSNPASPHYHQPVTQQEANSLFNPTADSENAVVDWLKTHGLTVTQTYPNHLMVDAQGSVAQVEAAFHITLNQYRAVVRGKEQTFYAPSSEAVLEGAIGNTVETVTGLDSYPRFFHPRANGTADGTTPYYPQDFANAYDLNPLWNAGYTGKGQHIGITMWSQPPDDSALQQFASDTGASVATQANSRLKVIQVDGGDTVADTGEAGMDVEMTSSMAPGATIEYYEAPVDSGGNPTNAGLLDALNTAGTDANNNRQITNSWGGCEASTTNDAWTTAAESIFAANTATGHNYFFSAGDNGSWCDGVTVGTYVNGWPDYPASSPNVTSVGGTSFSGDVGSSWPGEVAWPYCSSCSAGTPEGTGGGYSAIFSRPSWQTGSTLASNGKRGYPDISAVADPNTGAYVCYGPDNTSCAQFGGTSLASPLWAGMAAVVNQYLADQSKPFLGFLNPTLYTLAHTSQSYLPFHDVTSGTNGKYKAGGGWDAVTGLGTPDMWNIARDIASLSSGNPTNTPTPTPTSTSTGSSNSLQLVTDGGFETNLTGWESDSKTGSTFLDSVNPRSGSTDALLCGVNKCSDHLSQYIAAPANVSTATFSYWVLVTSADTASCTDNLWIRIWNTHGSLVSTPSHVCNSSTGWVQRTANLTSLFNTYRGQQLQINLRATTNASLPTSFRVDDISITVTTSTTAPKPTATPTPTKTPISTGGACPGSGCAQTMLSMLNADRTKYHVAPLTLNATQSTGTGSCVGAHGHSVHMAQSGGISHDQFPADICISFRSAGENVGEAGYGNELTDLQQLNSMMMAEGSPKPGCSGSHACNIINPGFSQVGIGVYQSGGATWLTEDFVG